MKIDLLFTPGEIDYIEGIEGKIGVVIDIIRTTTTITTAFKNGCAGIIPVLTADDAFNMRKKIKSNEVLLAGALKGEKIDGFDLGNSPLEFIEEVVKEKTIILRTTNGTKTMNKISKADTILIASFMNITALINTLKEMNRDTVIVCAGLQGLFSLEDTVCGGMIAAGLEERMKKDIELSDSALAARILSIGLQGKLLKMLQESEWGRHLASRGFKEDLKICASVDEVSFVPRMEKGRIVI
jgi:2-phosphosulfolactate phosphatase